LIVPDCAHAPGEAAASESAAASAMVDRVRSDAVMAWLREIALVSCS
jgi:hypothetical protein